MLTVLLSWSIVILFLPEGNHDYLGIGFLEIISELIE